MEPGCTSQTLALTYSYPIGWKLLLLHTAPNALYDSSARFDPPKCDPDTRVDILDEIMIWIQDRKGPTRLLCLTGAAGAGKSALQQTIAERCSSQKTLASAFFFATSDYTRNNLSKLVATVAYQIAEKDIRFRRLLVEVVERDPLIFEKSLKTQFDSLITGPYMELHVGGGEDLQSFPHAVLLDGLDECLDVQRQGELLAAIKDSFLSNSHLPFRIFLSSRPEWTVRTALNPTGHLHNLAYHIRLSDEHDATADIRLMLWRRLKDIGRRSDDPRAQPDLWPTEENIESLVEAALGQFIYAATVVKYVGEVRGSPVDRLRVVLTWKPEPGQRAKPFAPLDLLYFKIVSNAKAAYEAVDTNEYDFLALLRIFCRESFHHFTLGSSMVTIDTIEEALGLPDGTYHVLFSDMHALAWKWDDSNTYSFYHRSFLEWVAHKGRSGALFILPVVADAYAVSRILRRIQLQRVPGRCATFLAHMVWVHELPDTSAHPIIDLFLDFASEDGFLHSLFDSAQGYCGDVEEEEEMRIETNPEQSMFAPRYRWSLYRGLMHILANAYHSLRAKVIFNAPSFIMFTHQCISGTWHYHEQL